MAVVWYAPCLGIFDGVCSFTFEENVILFSLKQISGLFSESKWNLSVFSSFGRNEWKRGFLNSITDILLLSPASKTTPSKITHPSSQNAIPTSAATSEQHHQPSASIRTSQISQHQTGQRPPNIPNIFKSGDVFWIANYVCKKSKC